MIKERLKEKVMAQMQVKFTLTDLYGPRSQKDGGL